MRTFLLLSLICLTLACQNENSSSAKIAVDDVSTDIEQQTFSLKEIKKQDACKYLERGEMSKILQWNHLSVQEQLVESAENGKQSRCIFTHKDQVLEFRIAWEEESADNEFALVKEYGEYLEQGIDGVNFRVIKADAQTQTLFGIGRLKSGEEKQSYIVRKRYGNVVDVEMILRTNKNAPAEFRTKLMQLSDAINLFPTQID